MISPWPLRHMPAALQGPLLILRPPWLGAKTVLMEEFDPEGALALIEKEKVTAIGVVPTHLVRMLEVDATKYNLSSLRFIRSAGGYLPPQVAEEAEKKIQGNDHERSRDPGCGFCVGMQHR